MEELNQKQKSSLYSISIYKMLKVWSVVFGLLTFQISYSQDPTFSQFNLNQYYFNPAYTGYHGGYEFAATYRSLWPNVPGKVLLGPLATYYAYLSASFHEKGNYAGSLSVFAMQDAEGEGYLTTNTFGLSYAEHFAIKVYRSDKEPRLQLSVGFKGYMSTVSVNWDKLVFTDQLNVDYGISPSSGIGQSGSATTRPFWDMDAGLLLWNNFMARDKWYNEIGFSLTHILTPYVSITGATTEETRIPRKMVINYRSTVNMAGDHISFGPIVFFELQNKFYELNTGIDLYFRVDPSKNIPVPLTLSILHRLAAPQYNLNTNAVIVGLTHNGKLERNNKRGDEYYVGFAADFPYLGLAGQTKGAYEVTVGFVFRKKPSDGYKCPWGSADHSAEMNTFYKSKVKNN